MNCPDCGHPLEPAPAWFDGEPTTVGFQPCRCSWTAYLNQADGNETFAEYKSRITAKPHNSNHLRRNPAVHFSNR